VSSLRRSIGQARFNLANAKLVAADFGIVGLFVGVLTDSWVWGVSTFFSLAIGCGLPVVGLLCLSGVWALFFFSIGYEAGGIIGTAGSLVALGLHLSGVHGLIESAA